MDSGMKTTLVFHGMRSDLGGCLFLTKLQEGNCPTRIKMQHIWLIIPVFSP